MMSPRPLVAGNWKMNGTRAALAEIAAMARAYDGALRRNVDLLICPPATLLFTAAAAVIGSRIAVGGQDCHERESGAFTGALSAEMLVDAGALYVIVGHSERRNYNRETDEQVRAKAEAAARAGLIPIVCVGETREERDAGRTLDRLALQIDGSIPELEDLVVAYEPVWAIGAGLTPSAAEVTAAHGYIRRRLEEKSAGLGARTRILYGGSVKPDNAPELLATPDVDGALVGGASLRAADFMAIAQIYRDR
jgi:triosephosphate isomerase (TIM)